MVVAALAVTGCVEKNPGGKGKKISEDYVNENLLTAVPTMKNAVNADLGGKVVYLGNDVDTETLAPGGKVTVTHYWRITAAPGKDWRIFAHVTGATSQDWMNVDYTDMRAGYPARRWKAGDIIKDVQKFALKKDWTSSHAQLSVGMYRKGGRSIKDRMPIVSGPRDDQSRVKVFRFKVNVGAGAAKPAPKPAGYAVWRASGPIVIDGKADDAAWKKAPKSPAFVDAEGSPKTGKETRAQLLYDDTNLYVFLTAADDDVFSQYKKQDDPMWKEDVLELFIDADGNRRGYVELQVNPNNAHFDAWFATTRAKPGDVKWSANMKSAVVVHGSADNRKDKDIGWDVEIAIPLVAVKGNNPAMRVNIPPKPGDRWRLNIVRGDKPEKGRLRASSWNKLTYQDFHALNRMLTVTFADAAGATKPPVKTGAAQPGAPKTGAAPLAPAKGTVAPRLIKKGATLKRPGAKMGATVEVKKAPAAPKKPETK
jgi:hypothetical protein